MVGDGRMPPNHPHRQEIAIDRFMEHRGPRRRWLWMSRRWGGLESWAANRAMRSFYRAWKNRAPK